MPILNQLGFTQRMDGGVQIRTAQQVEVISAKESKAESTLEEHLGVRSLTTDDQIH